MLLVYPSYYKTFSCIASDCPDSCCHEWDVQVDAASAARYRAMEGVLGDALRTYLYDEDGETYLRNENGRCPMWRTDGLCRIQAEQGRDALCQVDLDVGIVLHIGTDALDRSHNQNNNTSQLSENDTQFRSEMNDGFK